jgi:hypothetical protein
MDTGIWGWVFFYVFCAIMGGVVLIFLWFFWQDAWPPIRNGLIKLNSEPAKATILEVKKLDLDSNPDQLLEVRGTW